MRIFIELTGGLGNQFFGYAFGYALSQKLGAGSGWIRVCRIMAEYESLSC